MKNKYFDKRNLEAVSTELELWSLQKVTGDLKHCLKCGTYIIFFSSEIAPNKHKTNKNFTDLFDN